MKFFSNITRHAIVVHTIPSGTHWCSRGKFRVPADERDLTREGEVEYLQGQPYLLRVCRACARLYARVTDRG